VLKAGRGVKQTYCKTKILCIKLGNYRDKYAIMRFPYTNIIPVMEERRFNRVFIDALQTTYVA